MPSLKQLRLFVLFLGGLLLCASVWSAPSSAQEKRWYKGNTHAHTINSDGDSTPLEVVTWYREHGYNFLVLSDHNMLTDVAGLNSVFAVANKFLLIPGEEVTDGFQGKAVHVNGLNVKETVKPQGGDSVTATIQNNVTAIREIEEDVKMRSKYTVHFIGQGGKVLQEVITNPAVYTFRGDETYVRAKIFESNGKMAWTQPVFPRNR